MPVITLETRIDAPAEIVFDLARSIDLHIISTAHTGEKAIAGRTSGLVELGESVTWKAKHFGVTQVLTSTITAYQRPYYFVDEMTEGVFESFRHEHNFSTDGSATIMADVFQYKSPFYFLGSLADVVFLKSYMKSLLTKRNLIIKEFAEDPEKYRKVLPV